MKRGNYSGQLTAKAAFRSGKKLELEQYIKGKRTVFITTKNTDYIRNDQEIKLLRASAAEVKVIGSLNKSYFWRILKIYAEILVTNFRKYDTVFIGFAPQAVLPFLRFKFRKNVIIEDFFISFFDTLCCDRKKFKEDSLAGKLLMALDRRTLQLGDVVICDTKAHGRYFTEGLGCDPEKLRVLYLNADDSIYYPRPERKRNPGDPVQVLYFGSILPLQGVGVIMQAAALLKDRKDIHFEIIGPLPEKYRTDADNVTYHSWLTQNELAEHIAASDLCLAGHFAGDIEKAKRTIPGKAYIYEAMGKPMILGENAANRERYTEGKDIRFVKMGDPAALAEAIVKACDEIRN